MSKKLTIITPNNNPQQLSQTIILIASRLNFLNAELARILHLQCHDIALLADGRWYLENNTKAWKQAELLVKFYQLLDVYWNGELAYMCHWIHREDKILGNSPFYLIVDQDHLDKVIDFLKTKDIKN